MKKSGSMKSMIVAIADRRWSSRGQRDFIALALNFGHSTTFLYAPSDSARFSFSSLSIRFPSLLDFFAGLFLVLDALATLNHTKGYKSGAFPGQLIQQEISVKWNKQISRDGEQFETNTAPANCIVNASRASHGIPVDSPLNRARPRKLSAPMHRWIYILFFYRIVVYRCSKASACAVKLRDSKSINQLCHWSSILFTCRFFSKKTHEPEVIASLCVSRVTW